MINTYADERGAIESYFKQTFKVGIPILWGNTQSQMNKLPAVRFQIIDGVSNQRSIGTTQLHRNQGQVVCQIFVKKGSGKSVIMELVDIVEKMFSIKQIDSIQFGSAYMVEIGEVDETFQINVVCPFYRNRIITR